MSTAETAPIYAQLVQEQGDVPSDVRRHAERTMEELHDVVDFGRTPSATVPGAPERTVRARPAGQDLAVPSEHAPRA